MIRRPSTATLALATVVLCGCQSGQVHGATPAAGADAMGGDAGPIGGDASGDADPNGDANASDSAVPGDSYAPGDDTPPAPTVTLIEQLFGAASVVEPFGAGAVAAMGGAVVRLDATGAITGRIALGRVIEDLAVDAPSSTIAAGLGDAGVVVIDGSGAALVEVSRIATRARGVWTNGTHVFVVPSFGGAAVYDWSGALLDGIAFDGPSNDLVVFETAAYVAQHDGRLAVIRMASSATFAGPASFMLVDGTPQGLHVSPNTRTLYIATGLSGVATLSVDDPAVVTSLTPTYFGTNALQTAGDNPLFVATGVTGVEEWDTTDLAQPAAVVTTHKARDVALMGAVAFVADDNMGVGTIDISTAGSPGAFSVMTPGGSVGETTVRGNHVLVAAGFVGLGVVDVAGMSMLATHDLSASLLQLADSGSVLYGIDEYDLVVIDLPDPASAPASVAPLYMGDRLVDVSAAGDTAFAISDDTLHAVDATDPTLPVAGGSWPLDGERLSLLGSGTLLAAVGDSPGVILLDVGTPTAPIELGRWGVAQRFDVAAIYGPDHLVLLDSIGRLSLVDISDPAAPSEVDSATLGTLARGIVVDGGWLWVSDRDGLLAVPISAVGFGPAVRTAGFGFAQHTLITGSTGVVAGAQAGVRMIEITP